MRAALPGQRNFAEALRAGFGSGRGGRRRVKGLHTRKEPIDREDHAEENNTSDDQERDGVIEKIADLEFSLANMDGDVREVGLPDRRCNKRVEDIADQSRDNSCEGSADNDGDCKVYNVSAKNKITKAFDHLFLQQGICQSPATKS